MTFERAGVGAGAAGWGGERDIVLLVVRALEDGDVRCKCEDEKREA